MKTFLALFILTIFLASCSGDSLAILKADTQIQSFLEEYPNADITIVKITVNADENIIIKELCGITLYEKEYYKATILDSESGLRVYAYLNPDTNDIACLKKIGKKETTPKESDLNLTDNNTNNTTILIEPIDDPTNNTDNQTSEDNEIKDDNSTNKEDVEDDSKGDCPPGELTAELKNGIVYLEWPKYECDDYRGYQIVWSQTSEYPKYPDDGYLYLELYQSETTYTHKPLKGNNYYAITILTKEGKVYTNPVSFTIEEDSKELQPIFLSYDLVTNGTLLSWTKYNGDDLQYYKVVQSQINENLQYPEDGYIAVISDASKTIYRVNETINGTTYYRISAILEGFSEDNTKRINSNVVEVEI